MTNQSFLQWMHDRLKHKHNENVNLDFMVRLQKIIDEPNNVDETESLGASIESNGSQLWAMFAAAALSNNSFITLDDKSIIETHAFAADEMLEQYKERFND